MHRARLSLRQTHLRFVSVNIAHVGSTYQLSSLTWNKKVSRQVLSYCAPTHLPFPPICHPLLSDCKLLILYSIGRSIFTTGLSKKPSIKTKIEYHFIIPPKQLTAGDQGGPEHGLPGYIKHSQGLPVKLYLQRIEQVLSHSFISTAFHLLAALSALHTTPVHC